MNTKNNKFVKDKLMTMTAPNISNVAAPLSSGRYEKYEISFTLNSYDNPFDEKEIDVFAEFWSPSAKFYKQNAFFIVPYIKIDDGSSETTFEILKTAAPGTWKIRFTPSEPGNWKFRITAIDKTGAFTYPSDNTWHFFECTPGARKGVISRANKRYLKYQTGEPYYPVGNSYPFWSPVPNDWRGTTEYGTNEMKPVITKLSNNGVNFIRLEINFLEGLNLMGMDLCTKTNYCHYINQRDSWQLDSIVDHAASKGVNILFAMFSHAYLGDEDYCNSAWSLLNPLNAKIDPTYEPRAPDVKGDCQTPYEFYSNATAIRLQQRMIRYVIARWGFATNLLGFELMDEADRIDVFNKQKYGNPPPGFDQTIVSWHQLMTGFIHQTDPFGHLITTAYADQNHATAGAVFNMMDFTQIHRYADYADNWAGDVEDIYYHEGNLYTGKFDRPNVLGEHGYLNYLKYAERDPHMYEEHIILWATLFNGSMAPASFWTQYDINKLNALNIYKGISNFTKLLPQFSEAYVPCKFSDSSLRLFYLRDQNSDEFYGWIQDAGFNFRNIYTNYASYLTNFSENRPPLSTNTPLRPVLSVSRNGAYKVRWFDTETGYLISTAVVSSINYKITLEMPVSLRAGKYADAAFMVEYQCANQWNTTVLSSVSPANIRKNSPLVVSNDHKVNYIGTDDRIHQVYWNGNFWEWAVLNANAPKNVRKFSELAIDLQNNVYFTGTDNRIHRMFWNTDHWQEAVLNPNAPANVRADSGLAVDKQGKVYFIGSDDRVHHYYYQQSTSKWQESLLVMNAPANVMAESNLAIHNGPDTILFYVGSDARIHRYIWKGSKWEYGILNSNAPPNVRFTRNLFLKKLSKSPLAVDPGGFPYFIGSDNRIHNYYWNVNHWQEAVLNPTFPQNVRLNSALTSWEAGKVHFIANDNRIHQCFWNGKQWQEKLNNFLDPQNVYSTLISVNKRVFFIGEDTVVYGQNKERRVWVSYWDCQSMFK
jgi:hypothetical protein